jgi:hypothetical protein
VLRACRKTSGYWDSAVGSARTELVGGLAEPQHCTFGVQLHLLQIGFLIRLLSALTHHDLQGEKTGIMEYRKDGILVKSKIY